MQTAGIGADDCTTAAHRLVFRGALANGSFSNLHCCISVGVARSLVKKLPTLTNADGATILQRLVKVVEKLQSRLAAMVDQQAIATAVRRHVIYPTCSRSPISLALLHVHVWKMTRDCAARQASSAFGNAAAAAAGDGDGSPVVSGSPSPPRDGEGNAAGPEVSR